MKPPKSNVICAWCSCNMTPNPELPHGMVSHGICDACMKQLERKSYDTLHSIYPSFHFIIKFLDGGKKLYLQCNQRGLTLFHRVTTKYTTSSSIALNNTHNNIINMHKLVRVFLKLSLF